MQIKYVKGEGIILIFFQNEMRVVVSILKALYKANPVAFIAEAIVDIEADLAPKALPMRTYCHLCTMCFRILDERDDNVLHLITHTDDKWKHKICPPLKENRP